MISVRCVNKNRNGSNQIVSYVLQDVNGNVKCVPASELKKLIKNKTFDVVNLSLTADGRLMDKTESTLTFKLYNYIGEIVRSGNYKNVDTTNLRLNYNPVDNSLNAEVSEYSDTYNYKVTDDNNNFTVTLLGNSNSTQGKFVLSQSETKVILSLFDL